MTDQPSFSPPEDVENDDLPVEPDLPEDAVDTGDIEPLDIPDEPEDEGGEA